LASLISIPLLAFDLFGFAYLANDFELTLDIRGELLGGIADRIGPAGANVCKFTVTPRAINYTFWPLPFSLKQA
jgi:hypothetical protein